MCRREPLRIVGEEGDHSDVGYRKDDEGKDNVGCAHSLLQRMGNTCISVADSF